MGSIAAGTAAGQYAAPHRLNVAEGFGNDGPPRPRGVRHYFFLPEPKVGCQPAPFWLGAAAMTLIFSFLGFLVSRLLLCSPLAMSISPWVLMVTSALHTLSHR